MRHKALLLGCALTLFAAGCSRLERLSIVRPTAERGDFTQVAPVYEVSDKGQRSSPAASADLVASASSLYQAGKLDLAERQASEALRRDPASGDAHTLLAAIASTRGDSAAAGVHYATAAGIDPANGTYANNYGTWLCANGRAGESLGWFDRALADPAYPTAVNALVNAGTCARRFGQVAQAEARWRQALASDPVNPQALAGMAGLQLEQARHLEARAFAERWLAVAPTDLAALRLASQVEDALGDNVAAERYRSRLRMLSPGAPQAPTTR